MTGPQAKYQAELDKGIIWHDQLQAGVVLEFERLYQDLIQLEQANSNRWFFQKKAAAPQGIYIYGSVGRGKTHLMDLFFDSLPNNVGKQRQHYHEFMLWLHHELRTFSDVKNPLNLICKRLSAQTKILCLDEFLVNDIANAMLLAGMLEAFSQYGIALVTTSNVKPDDLYWDGLQRAKFLPAIDWINTNMQVMHLDGEQDYRQQDDSQQHEHWYFPINPSSQLHLEECYAMLSDYQKVEHNTWQINDRKLDIIAFANQTLWCDFSELCQSARHASDYIELASQINSLIISGIPQMNALDDSAARRFITLIDVMYENEVNIVAEAQCHYKMIYQGEKMAFEFERAASRLAEMLVFE